MKTKRTLFVAGALSALVVSGPGVQAMAPTLIVTRLTGEVHIVQGVPCDGLVDVTTSIAGGRMEVTPAPVRADVLGGLLFELTRLDLFLTPFSVHAECRGLSATAEFREVGIRLAGAVVFTGEAVGRPEDRVYRFSIPKEKVLLYESVLDNAPAPQPETRYRRPSEDVTGLIDLGRRTAEIHVALTSRLRFRAGCVENRCTIDEERDGTQTADASGLIYVPGTDTDRDGVEDLADNCPLMGNPAQAPIATPVIMPPPNVTLNACQDHRIGTAQARDVCNARPVTIGNDAPARFAAGPNLVRWSANDGIDPIVTAQQTVTIVDATPPAASCTAAGPPGNSFQVRAMDGCGAATIRLGSYVLANGEVVKIEETGRSGVRLINTVGPDHLRHFQVGKGQAVITATDASNNVASAVCR